ncbi:BON domain-containing protein [Luteimonas marina]|nr:BON domain-containing protein [Luteimonas marina]
MKTSRIPLAIALSSALAFAVGCAADRDTQVAAEDAVDMTPADQTTPPPVEPIDPAMDATADADAGLGDGQSSDQPVDDTWITTKVKSSLLAESDVSGLDINVDTLNGEVTLRGQVESQAQVDTATRIAREIKGVTHVDTSGLTVAAAE